MALYKHKYRSDVKPFEWDGVTIDGHVTAGWHHTNLVRVEPEAPKKVQVVNEEVITEKVVGVTLNLTAEEAEELRYVVGGTEAGGPLQDLFDQLEAALDG